MKSIKPIKHYANEIEKLKVLLALGANRNEIIQASYALEDWLHDQQRICKHHFFDRKCINCNISQNSMRFKYNLL